MLEAPAPGTPTAMGTAFLGLFKFIKKRPDSAAVLEGINSRLSPESAEVLANKVIAIGEYPYSAFVEFIRACDEEMGEGDLELCRRLGDFSARLDVQSIYKRYAGEGKTEQLFRDSGLIWKSYYRNCGSMKTEMKPPDRAVITIRDFDTMDPAHCMLMEGWMDRALRETGVRVKEPVRETLCVSRGDDVHQFECRWG